MNEKANPSDFSFKTPEPEKPKSLKRVEGVISWDDYFMSVAFLSAMRSKDPNT